MSAARGGAIAMISMETREPIKRKASKRNMSPKTKPTNPDNTSHSQVEAEASTGKKSPRVTQAVRLKRMSAKTILR